MAAIRKHLLRFLLLAALAIGLVLVCAPLLTAAGVRGWIWWATRGQKLTCKIDGIDAALFRPVTLRGVRLTGNAEVRIEMTAPRVTVGLNLGSVFRMRGHAIHSLVAENVHAQIHRNQSRPFFSRSAWSNLQGLLPDTFKLTEVDLQIEQGETSVSLHGLSATGSAIENGQLQIREAFIASPHLRREFSDLRGATNWQSDRLTISALTLAQGLDLRSITADLSELDQERLGLEADVDAFHGKIRANISNDWTSQPSNWNAAGSATDVSLEQTLQALGFTDEVHGLLHACKFTFRGNFHDPKHATASLWTELTRLSWRRRAADVIMIGASLYNQQIQLQQLYVKQSANQLNASGEAVFPAGNFDWFNPNFGGNISASITDLGAFANLFGAEPGDFSGQIAIEGTINASDRKFGGHLAATGGALTLFKTPFESLGAKFVLTSKAFQIEQLELHRQKDFVRGEGTIELAGDHVYSGKATMAAAKLGGYTGLMPAAWRGLLTEGRVAADWTGHGKTGSHFGSFHLHGTGLRTAEKSALLPINAELEAEYSPGSIFFRQAHLTNEHASLNGFVTLASSYTQIQGLAFDLNAKPVLRGNVFLPLSASQLLSGLPPGDAAAEQKADLDLNIEPIDLRELSAALFSRGGASGKFATRLSIFGTLNALQGWGDFHGRDISLPDDSAHFSFDGESRFASGSMQTKASLQFSGSDPVVVDGNIPVFAPGHDATPGRESFAVNLNFPAVFPARLPRFISHDTFRDGIVSGKLRVVGPRTHPTISGDLQLTNGKLNPTWTHFSDASARMVFQGHEASIDFLNIADGNLALALHGKAAFDDSMHMSVELSGAGPLTILSPKTDAQCVNDIKIAPMTAGSAAITTDAIGFAGNANKGSWSLTIPAHSTPADTPQASSVAPARTVPICADETANGTSLVIGVEPSVSPTPEKPARRKKSRRR
jgi:hypothetical protein